MCPLPLTAVCPWLQRPGRFSEVSRPLVGASLRGSHLLAHPRSSQAPASVRFPALQSLCSAPAGRPARNLENRKVELLLSAQQPNCPKRREQKRPALGWKGVRRGSTVGTGEEGPSQEGPVPSFLTWLLRRTCLSGHLVDFRTYMKPFAQSAQPTRMHA